MITFRYTDKKFTDSIFHTVAIGRAYELLRHDLVQQLAEMQKITPPKLHNDGRSFICWKN